MLKKIITIEDSPDGNTLRYKKGDVFTLRPDSDGEDDEMYWVTNRRVSCIAKHRARPYNISKYAKCDER